MDPILKTTNSQDIFFFLLTISFLLLSFLKANYWKHTKLLLLGVTAQRYANQFLREDNAFTQRVNLFTFLLIIINFSVIIAKLLETNLVLDIISILFFVTLFYVLKVLIIKFSGYIFMTKEISKLYVFFSLLFDRALAIFIFPLSVVIYFFSIDIMQILLISLGVIFLVVIILKLLWLWRIGTKAFGLSRFYIFLYLCSLEISPLLLIAQGCFY